jgi:hypothetical protein
MLRKMSFITALLLISPVFLNSADAQEKKAEAKTNETKIMGTIVQMEKDPSGRLAPLAIMTDKDQYPLIQNALAAKMGKHVGSKAKITGRFVEVGNKKAIEAWLYERQGESGKKARFKQPVEG